MSCLFCDIAQKKIPCEVIFEDASTLAFLDISPRSAGHTLVIPKKHAETVLESDESSLTALILTIQKITGILHASLNPAGFTIGINHGTKAGQAVPHLHAHIIPRYEGDGGGNMHSVVNNPPSETISMTAARIRQKKV